MPILDAGDDRARKSKRKMCSACGVPSCIRESAFMSHPSQSTRMYGAAAKTSHARDASASLVHIVYTGAIAALERDGLDDGPAVLSFEAIPLPWSLACWFFFLNWGLDCRMVGVRRAGCDRIL